MELVKLSPKLELLKVFLLLEGVEQLLWQELFDQFPLLEDL